MDKLEVTINGARIESGFAGGFTGECAVEVRVVGFSNTVEEMRAKLESLLGCAVTIR